MVKVTSVSVHGGAVVFNEDSKVFASYEATDFKQPTVLLAQIKLNCGKIVQFYANRHTGLVTVDVIHSFGGEELLRTTVS